MKRKPTPILSSFLLLLLTTVLLYPCTSLAQNNRTITGVVTYANDKAALPGVSVKIKGTSKGVSSTLGGHYSIVAKTGDVLVFSSISYKTKEVIVGSQNHIDVALAKSDAKLDEVVVTALGITRKSKSLTYATQQLNNSDLTAVKEPSGNVINSLNGKIAGAVVTPAATGPGGAARIVLRGNRSISGNNNALIVVDGVPIDNTMSTESGGGGSANTAATQQKSTSSGYSGSDGAANINPEDVESITVLKGPAAAALYGSRAANGALMIRTKRGKSGQTNITYNGGITVDNALLLIKLQNIYGQGNGGIRASTAAGSWGGPARTYKNNVRDFYNTGTTINNSINISAGGSKMQEYASYTNNSINGIVPNNQLRRNTLNIRINNELLPGLTTDIKMTYVNQKIMNKPRLGDNGVTNEALIMPRDMSSAALKNFETVNPDNQQPQPLYWTNSSILQNPYWDVNRTALNEERNRIMLVGSAKYQIKDWLYVQGRYSLDHYDDKITGSYYEGTLPVNTLPGGRYQENNVYHQERNIDFLLAGNNKIGGDFGLNYNLGASVVNIEGYNKQTLANGLRIPNKFDLNFAANPNLLNTPIKKEIQSIYGSAELNYKQELFLNASARNDWSSTLPAPHSYFYPSVGVSALLSNLFKLPKWITFAKVRGTYTQVGNDADPYLLNQTYRFTPGSGNGFLARDQTKYINTLKPEKTKASELGMEWRFLGDRLSLDASVYKTNTVNQLIFIGLPQPSGFNDQYVNAGNIQNKGLEFIVKGTPIQEKDFTWSSTFNFSLNRNKILSLLPGISEVPLTPASNFASLLIRPGGSYGDLYGQTWEKDEKGQYKINSTGLPVVQPLQKVGNFNPNYTLGLSNQVDYKKFSLSFLVDGRVGGTIISGTDAMMAYFGVADYTTSFRSGGLVLPGVVADGSANTKAISSEQLWTQVSQGGTNAYSQFFAYSATNFRLRELSLAYTFDIKHSRLKTVRLSATGHNLFFLYWGNALLNIPGIKKRKLPIDPEAAIGTSNYQGIESGLLPSTRSFGLNASVSF